MSSTSTTATRARARITREEMLAAADVYDVDPADALAAYENMDVNGARSLVVSGWLGSGKDYFSPKILQMLGATNVQSHSFAKALKDEMDAIFATVRFWAQVADVSDTSLITEIERRSLAGVISVVHDVPLEQAVAFFAGPVADEAIANPELHSRMRTENVRAALQHLGTDVRRAQDDMYWVKRTIRPMIEDLASGSKVSVASVASTDGRFPNELDAVRAFGGVLVRLDITQETQDERVLARDGLRVTEEARSHISEHAVDDYEHFDVRVSNDGTPDETLAALMQGLSEAGLL